MEPAIGRDDDDEVDDKVSAPPLAAADGMLPTDILRQILLRLPVDVLCHLRLVCRSWRSLTSDPAFAKAHAGRRPLIAGLDRTRRAVHIIDIMSGGILRKIPVPPPHLGWDLTTAQPDLVCISPNHGPSFVLNSVTGAVTTLPKNKGCAVESPSILGLIPATGEHKVLRFYLESKNHNAVQFCRGVTLGANRRWRTGPHPPMIVEWSRPGHREVVDLWVESRISCCGHPCSTREALTRDSVTSFDLATEEWRPMLAGPLSSLRSGGPSDDSNKLLYHKHRHEFWLAKLDGCLVMVHYRDCFMNLWFLVDIDQGLWINKYSIQCEPLCRWSHACDPPHSLAVLEDGRIVFRVAQGVLRAYDPNTSM